MMNILVPEFINLPELTSLSLLSRVSRSVDDVVHYDLTPEHESLVADNTCIL